MITPGSEPMLALLAQVQNQNNANDGPPEELLIFLLAFVGAYLVVCLVVFIFFFLTLSKALSRCHWRNRAMEPGQVWLNFIPLFNIVWMIITANRVSESLRNEFYDRGWHRRGEDYCRGLGTATCVLYLVAGLPYCGCLFAIGWLICFIIYWVKISGFSSQLAGRYDDYREDDQYDDEDGRDDDEPKPRHDYDDGLDDRPWERR